MPIQSKLPWGREVPSPRLLALDLDGTLLNSDWKLSERNRGALGRAHEAGIQIAIVTGRRYSGARRLTSALTHPHYLVTNAGARLTSSKGEILVSKSWDPELVQALLDHLASFRGHAFLITDAQGIGEIICSEPNMGDPHVARYVLRNEAFLLNTDGFGANQPSTVLQSACNGTIDRMEKLRERLRSFPRIGQLHVSRTVYPERDFELVDVVVEGADKGSGLSALAKHLGITMGQIVAIGDNYADTSMLELAGSAIVMGNAPAEMKDRWPVAGTNDENGVAQVIEGLISS